MKPSIGIQSSSQQNGFVVFRGFVRGEFGPYYEWEGDEPTYDDSQIQLALGLGPSVVDTFTRAIDRPSLTSTEFDKLFANLQHDWRPKFGHLMLGWKPYKFGPIPIVPIPSLFGDYTRYESFLVQQKCIVETAEQHGTQVWKRYSLPKDSPVPWRELYRRRTDAATRAFISGLVKSYAEILKLPISRPRGPRNTTLGVFHDSLIILGAARNKIIAYRSGWFEVDDWCNKGAVLFPVLKAQALNKTRPARPILRDSLAAFAEPARLLHNKIEMYRSVPELYQKLEALQRDHEHVAVILEGVDKQAEFETVSPYPMANLEWAAKVARPFSSFVRHILTKCGLDAQDPEQEIQKDAAGITIDAAYVLNELLDVCPELVSMRSALELCLSETEGGSLDERTTEILSRVFTFIRQLFARPGFLPDPRPEYESRREHAVRMDGLVKRLREVAIAEPFAVGVADVRNLANLPELGPLFGVPYDDALSSLLAWLGDAAKTIAQRFPNVRISPVCADNLVLSGPPNDVFIASRQLIRETTRKLASADHNQLASFGLLRVGVALVDSVRGEHYAAVAPGIEAHKIGDRSGRPLGAIAVTAPVFDHLTPEIKRGFSLSDEGETKQGVVWVRPWSNEDNE
jgi:hypothetical protein